MIYFKNGTQIQGTIIEKTPSIVRVKSDVGNVFQFHPDEIERIEWGATETPLKPDNIEPIVASLLSGIVPDAGQAYNQQFDKAMIFAGAWGAGIYYTITAFEPEGAGVHIPNNKTTQFTLGLLLTYGSAVLAIVDAAITRSRINQQIEDRKDKFELSSISEPKLFGAKVSFRC